ncbi:isoleucine--tRNA ligase [Halomarina litorea]|uniref:isoleucine--tRNA ligase n=1 Tax=Halomarina litorea TaxID=2961595 RepID=UPI0020C36ADF|nr:isoleucine--tRNA ligase [Halomarina sp. BCD28]
MSDSQESDAPPERFGEVDDQYDPDAVEDRIRSYWRDVDAYEQTKAHRKGAERFFFVDGPPYTSGAAHMGTTWNKSLKDAYIRYKRMCGYDVTDRPGYDMHGLPIETKVEEKLGFENKKDIESFGMENFIEECKEYADDQLEGLQDDFKSFGVWMDWENPYRTVSPEYMEAAWWGFQQAHERGLVDRGKRSITQCPRCETAIAKNEVEYHEIESPSIYVKFPLTGREGNLVIWTTTPWTIPANTFVAVDEGAKYAAVRVEDGPHAGDLLYVASEVVDDVMGRAGAESYEVVEELDGSDLAGWSYEHPLPEEVPDHAAGAGAGQVYHADYVEMDRTGLVHSAPGHGQEDFERGQELGLEIFCPVGPDGTYTEAGGKYAGQFVRDANDDVIADLDSKGFLLANETHRHDYGQCWRCDTDIVFLATDQWFVTVTDVKGEMLDNLEDSEWHPQEARDNRFRKFIEGSPDWNVSRQRYWGIPIPIWVPSADSSANGSGEAADGADWDGDMDDVLVVGTREELAERVDQDVDPEAVDLHRPTVDDLTITEGGTTYERVPDVFDVWLDSSVASWGTLDYPGEAEDFEELWPADLIMEAHDQTRGWFWSQLGMGTTAMGEIPYKEVLMHGWALAEDGRKMSKSIGNVVTPAEALERHGADPMRLFLLSVNPQGEDMRFSWDEMATMERNLNILWNVFRFPLPYMRMDGFDPEAVDLADCDLELVDEWVLSRLQTVVGEMTDHWAEFRQDRALDALLEFVVEDVSRFYIQVVRERMWAEEDSDSKTAAYATLYHVLVETTKLLAPYAPYVADDVYGTLTGDSGFDTVHMCDWPAVDEGYRKPELESDLAVLRAVEEAGSNARQQAERKLRWPVPRVVVAVNDAAAAESVREHAALVRDRLNAREVDVIAPGEEWGELRYSAQADMSVLGPAFGGQAGEVMGALNGARVSEPTLDALEAAVEEELGESVELTDEMVEFVTETPEGVAATPFTVAGDERGVVYVDTSLTEDIESEGYAREVIRRVQEMRKDLDLDLDRQIRLSVDVADDRVAELVARHEALIAEEVRAAELDVVEGEDAHRKEWEVEDVTMTLAIEPLAPTEASD